MSIIIVISAIGNLRFRRTGGRWNRAYWEASMPSILPFGRRQISIEVCRKKESFKVLRFCAGLIDSQNLVQSASKLFNHFLPARWLFVPWNGATLLFQCLIFAAQHSMSTSIVIGPRKSRIFSLRKDPGLVDPIVLVTLIQGGRHKFSQPKKVEISHTKSAYPLKRWQSPQPSF